MLPELDESIARERIARRIALEFEEGDVVNLGIGIPTLVCDYIPPDVRVIFQADNGVMGVGPTSGEPDKRRIGAGEHPITILPGGSFFGSDVSFGLIRGGHVDTTVLGALEVDENGDFANWVVPGKSLPGMGGAMDLVVGAKRVCIAMTLATKNGEPKIVKKCGLPLTAVGVVSMIATEFAVFQFINGKLHLTELAPDITLKEIREHVGANFEAREPLALMRGF